MPLQQIANEILRLSDKCGSTPVLVTPSYLSLRRRFFLELVGTLVEKCDRSIRIDWYRGMPGLFTLVGDRLASAQATRTNLALSALMAPRTFSAEIQITASIARPGGPRRDLVIGLCDQRLELPAWTTPIRLGASPDELRALQSTALLAG